MIGSNQVSNVASSVVTPVALSGFKTPLLNEFEGASAAYSLRRLKSWEDGSKVVRVRRATDNAEQDFSSVDVANGTMANWVNAYTDLPLDVDSGAAAAYSLRNLKASGTDVTTSGDTAGDTSGKYVVQVRRSSDDAVQSFTASEVADGTLEGWVNADVDKLDLQTETGGLVGNVSNETANSFDFSVNNEGSAGYKNLLANSDITPNASYTATFNVELNSGSLTGLTIRSGNPVEVAAFVIGENSITVTPSGISDFYFKTDATSVADVSITNITLTQTTADGHVKTWYDQSGSDNDAVQTTPANQPKIVDGGNLVTDNDGKTAINGKGATLKPRSGVDSLSSDGTYSVLAVCDLPDQTLGSNSFNNIIRFDSDGLGGASSQRKPMIYLPQSDGKLIASSPSYTQGSVIVNKADTTAAQLLTNIGNPALSTSNNKVYLQGDLVNSSDLSTDVNTEQTIGVNTALFDERETTVDTFLSEVIYYPSDQSTNRTAIEANMGDYYNIDLPAGVDSGNNEVDGFVTKWYDQSGNGNDAVQTTAANQPKIVDGGTLVTRNGDAAIKSTSDNEMAFALDSLSADGQQSVFAVLENDVTSQDGFGEVFKVFSTSTSTGGVNRRPYWFVNLTGALNFSVDSASGYQNSDREYRLYSHVMNDDAGGTSTVHRDGTQVDTRSITLDANATFNEGRVLGVTTNATGALYMSEVIYYPSDQTANRPAIETNINAHYNIY